MSPGTSFCLHLLRLPSRHSQPLFPLECNSGPAYSTIANDMWSLGVILCNLAFGRNPWAQAVATDATFAAYASNPSYLSAILPTPPAVARILTGPRGLFSIDPRRRMNIKELRDEVMNVGRWTMSEDEARYASPEAKSVAVVLRNAVRERDARLASAPAPPARQVQSHSETQRRRATTQGEMFISPAAVRQQELVVPQQIIVPPAPAPVQPPARPSSAVPSHHHHTQQQPGRNSSLRLVLQKVAAPFTSSHSHIHARKTSGITAISTSSSSSSSSLNSPMPLTPPGSLFNSSVDVSSPAYHYRQQQQLSYGEAWRGSSATPPPPPGLAIGIGKKEWLYQEQQAFVPQAQVAGGMRR
jgi:hypothetical protein